MFGIQFGLLASAEVVTVGWRRSSIGRYCRGPLTPSRLADLVFAGVAVAGLLDLFVSISTLGIGYLVGLALNQLLVLRAGLPELDTGSAIADGLIFYLMLSLCFYWMHRLFHGALWSLHRFHHSSEELTLLNGLRHHPLFFALSKLVMVWPVAITGLRPTVLAVVMSFDGIQQLLQHWSVPHSWGWFGRWVLQSPAAHRVHHAAARERANSNFSGLVIWDRLFGTYSPPVPNIAIGIEDRAHNRRLFVFDLLDDARDFFGWVGRGLRSSAPPIVAASVAIAQLNSPAIASPGRRRGAQPDLPGGNRRLETKIPGAL